jgi:hypothetical protein
MAISITVDGQPYGSSPIVIKGDGIKFATVSFQAPGNPGAAWTIETIDGLLPFDNVEGLLDSNSSATVYLGPTRFKGDGDFKVKVGAQNKTAKVRLN